jgi:hypothetical protein
MIYGWIVAIFFVLLQSVAATDRSRSGAESYPNLTKPRCIELQQRQSGSLYIMPVVRIGGRDDEHSQAVDHGKRFVLLRAPRDGPSRQKGEVITTPAGLSPKFRITPARKESARQRKPAGATIILASPNPKCGCRGQERGSKTVIQPRQPAWHQTRKPHEKGLSRFGNYNIRSHADIWRCRCNGTAPVGPAGSFP